MGVYRIIVWKYSESKTINRKRTFGSSCTFVFIHGMELVLSQLFTQEVGKLSLVCNREKMNYYRKILEKTLIIQTVLHFAANVGKTVFVIISALPTFECMENLFLIIIVRSLRFVLAFSR